MLLISSKFRDKANTYFKYFNFTIILFFCCQINHAQSTGKIPVCKDMEFWLKADAGISLGPNAIQQWLNQSNSLNHPLVGGNPQWLGSALNYNPTVSLDGNGDFFKATADIQSNANGAFIVAKAGVSGIQGEGIFSIMDDDSSTTYDGANLQSAVFFARKGIGMRLRARIDNVDITDINGALDNQYHLYTTTMNGLDMFMYQNGFLESLNPHNATLSAEEYYLGCRYYNGGPSRFMNGQIAEVIHYNKQPGSQLRRQIESYLAIKYAIILSNTGGGVQGDYYATDGSLLWDADDAAAYHNNIIGLGRNDELGLYQKQSHLQNDRVRIYVGALASSNASNNSIFNTNQSYCLLGDNNQAMCNAAAATSEMPSGCNLASRIDREWKLTKHNFNNPIQIDLNLNGCSSFDTLAANSMLLLVDDDVDFSNGGTQCYANGDGTGILISNNNSLVTIAGISSVQVANNSTQFLTLASLDILLPLTVHNFKVQCSGNSTILNWHTPFDASIGHFEIESSIDGIHFEFLDEVPTTWDSLNLLDYVYEVQNFSAETQYYRIKQVQQNGQYYYTGIRAITCGEQNGNFTVYPNPFNQALQVVFSEPLNKSIDIQLADATGRICFAEKLSLINGKGHLSLAASLAKGMYILEVKDAGLTKRKVLIKSN